jgi:membrane protein DedA with SNARE-associated domain
VLLPLGEFTTRGTGLQGEQDLREALLETLGRLPVLRYHLDKHLESARADVRRRKGGAVFFGRFTAALRVLVPGAGRDVGRARPVVFAFNVAGGALWGRAPPAPAMSRGSATQEATVRDLSRLL